MQFDTTVSVDLVVAILAILAAIWRLEGKLDKRISALRTELKGDISELRTELKGDISELRTELKGDISELRTELKGDISELRTELKGDITELRTEQKGDITELRADLRRVEGKVDDCNQRVARVEGIILAREDMVDTITESPQ